MTDKILVFSNCATEDEAKRLARRLVEERLAACVNILSGVRSLYRWQGEIEEAAEWMLSIKTRRPLFERLCEELRQIHSYQVPEIVAIPIVDGHPDYLDWIDRETAQTTDTLHPDTQS